MDWNSVSLGLLVGVMGALSPQIWRYVAGVSNPYKRHVERIKLARSCSDELGFVEKAGEADRQVNTARGRLIARVAFEDFTRLHWWALAPSMTGAATLVGLIIWTQLAGWMPLTDSASAIVSLAMLGFVLLCALLQLVVLGVIRHIMAPEIQHSCARVGAIPPPWARSALPAITTEAPSR